MHDEGAGCQERRGQVATSACQVDSLLGQGSLQGEDICRLCVVSPGEDQRVSGQEDEALLVDIRVEVLVGRDLIASRRAGSHDAVDKELGFPSHVQIVGDGVARIGNGQACVLRSMIHVFARTSRDVQHGLPVTGDEDIEQVSVRSSQKRDRRTAS